MRMKFDIQRVMDKYGLKQKDIAKAANLSSVTISNYKRGTAYPSIPSLMQMSEDLDIPIADFFVIDGEEEEETASTAFVCPHCKKSIELRVSILKEKDE